MSPTNQASLLPMITMLIASVLRFDTPAHILATPRIAQHNSTRKPRQYMLSLDPVLLCRLLRRPHHKTSDLCFTSRVDCAMIIVYSRATCVPARVHCTTNLLADSCGWSLRACHAALHSCRCHALLRIQVIMHTHQRHS